MKFLNMTIKQISDEVTEIALVRTGFSKCEKRGIAVSIPVRDKKKCIQYNTCAIKYQNAVIRPYLLTSKEAASLKTPKAKSNRIKQFRLKITPFDCTSFVDCIQICPNGALKMIKRKHKIDNQGIKNWNKCITIPNRCHFVSKKTVRDSQFLQPLLKFNGICPIWGEPAFIKLLTQIYADQLYITSATGCSLIWAATFP